MSCDNITHTSTHTSSVEDYIPRMSVNLPLATNTNHCLLELVRPQQYKRVPNFPQKSELFINFFIFPFTHMVLVSTWQQPVDQSVRRCPSRSSDRPLHLPQRQRSSGVYPSPSGHPQTTPRVSFCRPLAKSAQEHRGRMLCKYKTNGWT